MIATAMLDRLLHHATTITSKSHSYRLKDKQRAGLLGLRKEEGGKIGISGEREPSGRESLCS